MPDKSRRTQSLAKRLLRWYDTHRRELPWRAKPGAAVEPYRVWLSEIMLQQTTVAAVANYYKKFIARWPDVAALASARLDDVLAAWAGLGYYARARNLHKTAQAVSRDHHAQFPKTADELRKLPGIGHYTAGAIAAIAFGAREAAVDANAERVLARFFGIDTPLPEAKPLIRARAQSLVPQARPGDFAQALMDLGALVCTPKRPSCRECPWAEGCRGFGRGVAETLPRKGAERVRPMKRGAAFVARDGRGAVLLVKRPENGLLGGMLEPPLGPWTSAFPSRAEALLQAPFRGQWKKRPGVVRHGFTHFELEIEVYIADAGGTPAVPVKRSKRKYRDSTSPTGSGANEDMTPYWDRGRPARSSPNLPMAEAIWIPADKLKDAALPTVMRKIIAHGIDDGGPLFARQARRGAVGARRQSK